MENSSWMVYSILKNINSFIKGKKDVDLFKKLHFLAYKRASKFYIENSKRIYNDIENGYYTCYDLVIFILFKYMIDEKFSLYEIRPKEINEIMKLFTIKKLKEDLKLIKEIHKELKFKKGLKEYFEIKEDGTNIAYILTKKRRISPVFFIRNFKKVLTNREEDVIIKSKEYKQFERIAIKIKETIKGGSLDEQAEIQD